ncbi:MAG TPA: hypothetical protein VNO18_13480 [Xanthobacteraceae bacterium]|jgi:hypothetical protein|nr:hypothetical protein [Xanthobacteraceae bacterium]
MMILPCCRGHYSGERVAVGGVSLGVRPALRSVGEKAGLEVVAE